MTYGEALGLVVVGAVVLFGLYKILTMPVPEVFKVEKTQTTLEQIEARAREEYWSGTQEEPRESASRAPQAEERRRTAEPAEERREKTTSRAIQDKSADPFDVKQVKELAEKTLREQPWYSDDAVAAKTVLWELSAYEDDKRRAMVNLSMEDYLKWKENHPPVEALYQAKSALEYEKSIKNQPIVRRQR